MSLRSTLGLMFTFGAAIMLSTVALAQKHPTRTKHAAPMAKISAAQAKQIALKRYHGRVVGKVALENEEGVWQYSVMVRSGKTLREVMVDAKTGKIDSVEVTTAAKERAETKADKARANAHRSLKSPKKP
ncbi:PepSY domain-containing protein [Chthonomonas calidirosea]|uniref:PepSY domain-containing protein n=1 Tax=Chthonomonas calidirosea TaxID=454171 RepID=UPI0006EC5FDA|nr:PepSY domain-containing protein [Chthonomonas calidirosea]CEK18871.1 Peptidase propeptide domain-containing protein [Chthonomonas calidirosea]